MTPTQPRAIPSIQQVLPTFKEFVRAEDVRALAKASGKRFYERLYTPLIVVWGFIFQRLNPDHTLDAVVSHVSSSLSERVAREGSWRSTACFVDGQDSLSWLPIGCRSRVRRTLWRVLARLGLRNGFG